MVMVIVTMVALAAYGFNQQMADAYRSSKLQIERAQARLTVMSAIEALQSTLEQPRGSRLSWHREPAALFTGVSLRENASQTEDVEPEWMFSVLSPADPAAVGTSMELAKAWRFGLTNESSKINLLALNQWEAAVPGQAKKTLMNLPGMDLAMAQALMNAYGIVDTAPASAMSLSDRIGAFSDEQGSDGVSSSGGDDADERIRQWANRWTGGDWDMNYQLDSLEQNLLEEQTSLGATGSIEGTANARPVAWRDHLTFDSGQRNESLTGQPRVFLNGANLQKLHQDLLAIWPADWANFVIAVRQFGVRGQSSSRTGTSSVTAAEWTPDFSIPASVRIASPLELANATVEVSQANEKPFSIRSPFSDDFGDRSNYIRSLVDDVTVHPSRVIVGQVDVMEAPRPVLLGIPTITPEIVDQIIERRASQTGSVSPTDTNVSRDTIAWLLIENVVDLPTFIKLQPWITVGGDCYHAQIVAFRDPFTPTFRCTVTLDGSAPHVALRSLRQWDAWGKGFTFDELRGELSPNPPLDHAGSHLP
ncbi:general secretion pathway protein K [Rhodopirellula islandica]|uniref:General secretion pathway protein K n=1 Tax=Rhodopirellula islandica TaxID=595434 RepID=A0A0J1BGQ7_RHOIS|nr:general secretion pathway protein K [Rhodopirellula islandica]